MGVVIGKNLILIDYPDRVAAVVASGVAMWDVVGSAERARSLEQKMRNEQLNDLRHFVKSLAALRAVAFNGKKAATLAGDALDKLPIDVLHLPFSSPA